MLEAARHDASLSLRLPALIDSTARAAGHFASARAIASGSMATLTHSVLRAMIVSRWLKAATIAGVVATAGASGGLLFGQAAQRPGNAQRPAVATAPAVQQNLVGPLPEGTIAKIEIMGTDIPAENIKPKLSNQVGQALNRERLSADLKTLLATKWFSDAYYAVAETPPKSGKWTLAFIFKDLTFTANAQIGKLQSLISEPGLVVRANAFYGICQVEGQSVISWILPDKSAVKKGDLVCHLDSGPLNSQLKKQQEIVKTAEAAAQSAKVTKEAAERALSDYTAAGGVPKQNVLQALQAHLDDQQANEIAKQVAWAADKATVIKLERQIASCDIHAPADGIIYHANETPRPFNNRIAIANGTRVRERPDHLQDARHQELAARRDPSAEVGRHPSGRPPESAHPPRRRARPRFVRQDQRAQRASDPGSYFNPGPQVYTTKITIDNPPPDLVTDMKVRVEIDVADLENVLIVPATAVISVHGKDHVAVKKPVGGIECAR